MSSSVPGKRSHENRLCAICILIFKISSQEKKSNADRYQYYLKRQENKNSLTDSEYIQDIGESLLESSVIQSSTLSAATEDISNEDSLLIFYISGENPAKKYMEKSVPTDKIKFLPKVTI